MGATTVGPTRPGATSAPAPTTNQACTSATQTVHPFCLAPVTDPKFAYLSLPPNTMGWMLCPGSCCRCIQGSVPNDIWNDAAANKCLDGSTIGPSRPGDTIPPTKLGGTAPPAVPSTDSPTPNQTTSSEDDEDEEKSLPLYALIIIIVVPVLLLIGVGVFLFLRMKKGKPKGQGGDRVSKKEKKNLQKELQQQEMQQKAAEPDASPTNETPYQAPQQQLQQQQQQQLLQQQQQEQAPPPLPAHLGGAAGDAGKPSLGPGGPQVLTKDSVHFSPVRQARGETEEAFRARSAAAEALRAAPQFHAL